MAEDEDAPRDFQAVLNGNKPERSKPIIQTSKTATKVDMIKEMVERYGQRSIDDLLKAIMRTGDKQELEAFRTLKLGPNFQQIFCQAISEIDISRKLVGHTFVDTLMNEAEPAKDCMETTETAILFVRWCREQNINPGDFLLKLYSVLDKTFPKLNCFTLHGRSNAGKTFWLSPLTQALPDVVGQTIQSQDVAYQSCTDKQVIEIPELTLTKPEQVEETKKIFEGIPTMVNIKNKEPKKLERTPVLLSCNTLPWNNFLNEQKALRNRMFIYENLQESAVLAEVDKAADIRFFLRTFDFIKNEIATTQEWPQTPTDDFWSLYQDRVTDYLKDTIKHNTMTLEKILTQHRMSQMAHCRVELRDIMQDSLSWIPKSLFRDETRDVNLDDLQTVMSFLMDDRNEDYYFDMKDYRNPKLMSGMTDKKYVPEHDIDEQDFLSFKKGYINIERLQLRLKNQPLPTGTFTVEHMIREWLRKMSSILLHIVRTEAPIMRREEDETMKLDQELSFGAHIQAASTPEQMRTSRKRKTPDLSPILPAPETKKQKVEETNRRLFNPALPKLKIDLKKKDVHIRKEQPPKAVKGPRRTVERDIQ